MIPLAKLRIHPANSRVNRPQERIEEVKEMLTADNKQRELITVVPGRRPDDVGFFYILSGQTRFHAANLAGWIELDAQINADIDPDDHVAFWGASLEHNTSIRESDWDVAFRAKQLIDKGFDPKLVEKASRRDGRALRRCLAMMDLPEEVLSLVRANTSKLSSHFCEPLKTAVTELGPDAAAAIAKLVIKENLSHGALKDHVEREIRKKQQSSKGSRSRAKREFMAPVFIGGADQKEAGALKVMQSSKNKNNRVVTLIADLPEELAEKLKLDVVAAIEKLANGSHDS